MPRVDKTGPLGQGSMTGRKFRNCNNHNGLSGNENMNNTGFGYGRRMNNSHGMGRRFSSDHILYNEKNTNDLQNEILQLKGQLKSIEEKTKIMFGKRLGNGSGKGLGRGGGQGRNNGGALGNGGYCICAKCGEKIPHEQGIKCTTIKCPNCGKTMIREELITK